MERLRIHYISPSICIFAATLYGLTSAFSITSWVNYSIIGASLIGAIAVGEMIKGEINFSASRQMLLVIAGMVISTAIAFALSTVPDAEKSLNHTTARLFTIVVLLLLPYILLNNDMQLASAVRKGLLIALAISVTLIVYDFLRLNGYLDFGPVPHLETGDELDATHRVYIYRARGGSVEPGHDASVIAAIFPLLVDRMKENWRLITLFSIGFIVYFMGYSTTLILWGFVFSLVYAALKQNRDFKERLWSIIRILFIFVVLFSVLASYDLVDDLEGKLDSVSYDGRVESLEAILLSVLESFKTLIFGYGPGGYISIGVFSITNTFAALILDCGLFGLSFYIAAIFVSGRALYVSRDPLYIAAFFAYLLTFVMAIGNYWFPTHWLFLMYPVFARLRRYSLSKVVTDK